MPTPGSMVGKKSSWPMPRMKTTAALLAPELPAVVLKVRLGTDCATAEIRSEEHTSELQSLMRISYAVFCLKKKKTQKITSNKYNTRQHKDKNHNTRDDMVATSEIYTKQNTQT